MIGVRGLRLANRVGGEQVIREHIICLYETSPVAGVFETKGGRVLAGVNKYV